MFCPKCGNKLNENGVCVACGYYNSPEPQAQPIPTEMPNTDGGSVSLGTLEQGSVNVEVPAELQNPVPPVESEPVPPVVEPVPPVEPPVAVPVEPAPVPPVVETPLVNNVPPVVEPVPPVQSINNIMPQGPAPVDPINQPQPIPPTQEAQKKKSNAGLYIIIILLIAVIIALVVIYVVKPFNISKNSGSSGNEGVVTPTTVSNEQTFSLYGITFTLPAGYEFVEKGEYNFLVNKTSKIAVAVDLGEGTEDDILTVISKAKTTYTAEGLKNVNISTGYVDKHFYGLITYSDDENNDMAVLYMYFKDDIVMMSANIDRTTLNDSKYTELIANVLDSAKISSSQFAASNDTEKITDSEVIKPSYSF